MEKYFVITNCDGDTHVDIKSKEELLEDIREGNIGCEREVNYLTEEDILYSPETNYWGGRPLIIKGHIVSPKPVKVVTDYDVE